MAEAPLEHEPDANGQHVMIGLSWDETREFKALDLTLPFNGQHVWPTDGVPQLPMERRWHELWTKHRAALSKQRRA